MPTRPGIKLILALGAQATSTQFSLVIDGVTYRVLQVDSQGRIVVTT